jgi:hypothetical protein
LGRANDSPDDRSHADGSSLRSRRRRSRVFTAIPLQPLSPDRYEITFDDVPVDARVSLRINDQNSCDQNPTGAVTRNVSVNRVDLLQNTTTPGHGEERGFAFSITATGRVTQ